MKILMYDWGAYNNSDICNTFLKKGHTVDTFFMRTSNAEENEKLYALAVENIKRDNYGFVMSVNFFPVISDACMECGIVYVAWNCDSPLLSMHNVAVYNECNYIFTFDKSNLYEMKNLGVNNIFYMPLCADTDRISNSIKSMDGCDISFVGSLYKNNLYDEMSSMLPEYVRGYLDAAMLAQMNVYGDYILYDFMTERIIESIKEHTNLVRPERSFYTDIDVFLYEAMGFKIANMERIKVIEELSKVSKFYYYGDDFQIGDAISRGKADYLKEVPSIYASSKINLNMTMRNIKTGIPLRVYDIMASGGFLITNFQIEYMDYFEDGRDLVWYENMDDLRDKTIYYLKNDEKRKSIAYNGYDKVKKYHTYDIRLDDIMNIVKI